MFESAQMHSNTVCTQILSTHYSPEQIIFTDQHNCTCMEISLYLNRFL